MSIEFEFELSYNLKFSTFQQPSKEKERVTYLFCCVVIVRVHAVIFCHLSTPTSHSYFFFFFSSLLLLFLLLLTPTSFSSSHSFFFFFFSSLLLLFLLLLTPTSFSSSPHSYFFFFFSSLFYIFINTTFYSLVTFQLYLLDLFSPSLSLIRANSFPPRLSFLFIFSFYHFSNLTTSTDKPMYKADKRLCSALVCFCPTLPC